MNDDCLTKVASAIERMLWTMELEYRPVGRADRLAVAPVVRAGIDLLAALGRDCRPLQDTWADVLLAATPANEAERQRPETMSDAQLLGRLEALAGVEGQRLLGVLRETVGEALGLIAEGESRDLRDVRRWAWRWQGDEAVDRRVDPGSDEGRKLGLLQGLRRMRDMGI